MPAAHGERDLPRRLSLRNRLILFAAACLLSLLVLISVIIGETADAGRDQVLDAQVATAEVVASVLGTTLSDNQKVLQELASIDRVRRMDPGSATEVLDQFSRAHPNLYGLFLLGPQGNLVASTGLDPTQFQSHSAFIDAVDRSLKLGEPGVSNALTAPDARVIALTMPVRTKDQAEGEPIGVIGSLLSVERLGAAVTPFASGDTLIAVIADGMVIAAQGADPAVNALAATTVPALSTSGRGIQSYVDQDGKERIAVYAPVPGSTWGVLVTNPSPAAYGSNQAMVSRSIVAVAAAAVMTLALGALAAELLARPLRELRVQADALAQGDFSPREPVQTGSSEMAELSEALGETARQLGEQVRDLEQAREAGAAQAGQLRDLNRRTVRLQEDERRRIAGEIHDAVSHLITGALYQARALRLGTPDDPCRTAARRDSTLDSIGELLSKAMEELHGVIFALRPPELDDIGVFEVIDDVLRVTIRDNGAGFNPQHTARPTALGLLSMRERAAAIGAAFAVMSRPGDGTTVMIERPIDLELTTVPELESDGDVPEIEA